jgi:hypothetical protein
MAEKIFLNRQELPPVSSPAVQVELTMPSTSRGSPGFDPKEQRKLLSVSPLSIQVEPTAPSTSGGSAGFDAEEQWELQPVSAFSVRVEPTAPSTSRGSPGIEPRQRPFKLLSESDKFIKKYNVTGSTMLIKFNEPAQKVEPLSYLREFITAQTDYLARGVKDCDCVGLKITNTENATDKAMWLSFRRRDQLKPDIIMELLEKVIQSNARFGLSDRLEISFDCVRLPSGNREKSFEN